MPAGRPMYNGGEGAKSSQNVQKSEGATAPVHRDKSGEGYGYKVVASWYTGSGGGSCGGLQNGKLAFAELSSNTPSASGAGDNFNAMGDLPCGTALNITYNGKTVTAYKEDVGGGGAGIGGVPRVIDLYENTAHALGFSGLGYVYISRVDGKAMTFPAGGVKGAKAEGAQASSGAAVNVPAAVNDAESVADFLGKLGSGALWLMVAKIVGGALLVLMGAFFLLKGSDAGQSLAKGAGALAMA